jgi:uncharacterized protein YbjT (DUF2867 family)
MINPILVAGAAGETGRIIVRKLIERGHAPHVLVRDSAAAKKLLGKEPIYFQGDVRDIQTLLPAVKDAKAIISVIGTRTPVGKNCPKRVDFEGIKNLVQAACQSGVQRFIHVSSIGVTHPEHPMNGFGHILSWKLKGETVLRKSNLPYTIVRPGGLKNTSGGRRIITVGQGDQMLGMLSREDLAEVCLQVLDHPQTHSTTFEVIETDQKGSTNWESIFANLICDKTSGSMTHDLGF